MSLFNVPKKSEIKSIIAGRVRFARKARGITQESLGEKIKKSKDFISRYENGVQSDVFGLILIAEALKIPPVLWLQENKEWDEFWKEETEGDLKFDIAVEIEGMKRKVKKSEIYLEGVYASFAENS